MIISEHDRELVSDLYREIVQRGQTPDVIVAGVKALQIDYLCIDGRRLPVVHDPFIPPHAVYLMRYADCPDIVKIQLTETGHGPIHRKYVPN